MTTNDRPAMPSEVAAGVPSHDPSPAQSAVKARDFSRAVALSTGDTTLRWRKAESNRCLLSCNVATVTFDDFIDHGAEYLKHWPQERGCRSGERLHKLGKHSLVRIRVRDGRRTHGIKPSKLVWREGPSLGAKIVEQLLFTARADNY